ncbi:hypothetical protein [Roseovarius sp. Pro17]|uniref:hypothetical protein n=1 Tax=Roseovarius sp. Pro17 TaxID=3108175 RepID=UPI002D794215|nr:hypothetical protein [Roseovarius sp. Pro17]
MTRNSSQAAQLGLQGTPAFIIGKAIYPGAMDRTALLEAIAQSRGRQFSMQISTVEADGKPAVVRRPPGSGGHAT